MKLALSLRTLLYASCSPHLQRQISPNFIMKIYKDVFSGDELFSDTYPMKLVDNCMYEVYGKHITRVEGEVKPAGSTSSAEAFEPASLTSPSTRVMCLPYTSYMQLSTSFMG